MADSDFSVRGDYVFFWGSFLSNFEKCSFAWTCMDGKGEWHAGAFFCSEQAFMWAKALYFNDFETADKILAVEGVDSHDSPLKCKKLGQQVKGYDDAEWSKVRFGYMVQVNFEKYSQNRDLKEKFLEVGTGRRFVEASPFDRIWGIGKSMDLEDILDESKWKGENLLGKALDQVRDMLLLKTACAPAVCQPAVLTAVLRDGRSLECAPRTESSPEQFAWPADDVRRREYELFKKNAHFIFENREKILSDARMFFAPVNIQSGGAYIGAFVKPTVGSYVEWWIAHGKDELALYVSGSPLSGANVSKSITKSGKTVELKPDGMFLNLVKEFNSFHRRYKDVRENVDAYTLEEVVSRLKQDN